MPPRNVCRIGRAGVVACALLLAARAPLLAAEPASVAETNGPATNAAAGETQEARRAFLVLQDQLRSALLSFEQARRESDAAGRSNTALLTARLQTLEQAFATQLGQALASQREHDLEVMQNSNRVLLLVAILLVGVGILTTLLTVWLQTRAMSRLAQMVTATGASTALALPSATALAADVSGAEPPPPDPSATRLLGVVEKLEQRVDELEHTAHAPPAGPGAGPGPDGQTKTVVHEPAAAAAATATVSAPAAEKQDRVAPLLAKAQTLLNLGQAAEALACLDEALALNPRHTETLMKRGTALERLQRLEEALECYERAIAADGSLTLAYLHKGGVYNQLERFDEALECYEQALRSQQQNSVRAPSAAAAAGERQFAG
jgi:tetratricopeptide (TPR) repeat protein